MCAADFGDFWAVVGAFGVGGALLLWGILRNQGWRERR
jgi:hypothetical protein